MHAAICIIARNESATIGKLIAQFAKQTLLQDGKALSLDVVCNGCTDNTVQVAQSAISAHLPIDFAATVHDIAQGGKARTWNFAVHELLDRTSAFAIFMDADIELANNAVLSALLLSLTSDETFAAVSGYPVKDIAKKTRKSVIDRFSLRISAQTPELHSINGSLYAARMEELQKIWLPVPTPGEDGMISAMIHTEGFSQEVELERIKRMDKPTHYFEAHSVRSFFQHERRMTVGTVINGWIFEHLWAGKHETHVGPLISKWNSENEGWVDDLVAANVGKKSWALPPRMLTWRLRNLRGNGVLKGLGRLPFSAAATLLNLWPNIQANRTIKQRGSANYW